MLWKKESDDTNAMYVDLFKQSFGQESVATQYLLTKMARADQNSDGFYYKNDTIANLFRQSGNNVATKTDNKNRFIEAMELYNKSLCFAENNSKNLGLAYANRACCFLGLKMFKKCLTDIELAKQNNYPANLLEKLEKHKIDCLKRMEIEEDQSEIGVPTLDFEANEMFPCLANVLDVRNSDEYGRHTIAIADIDVGKTVIVESCYFGVTKFDHYKSCNICLNTNQNFIPCTKCTSALFCLGCRQNELHGIECDMTFGCKAGWKFMDVIRSISLAKNAFTNANELMAFVEEMLQNSDVELPSNVADQRTKYRAFFKLCPDWQRYELYLQQAYLFYHMLLEQKNMSTFFHTKAQRRFLMHLVQHHISMILRGAYNKRLIPIGGVNITDTYVNIVAKHLNHSCIPNVCHILKDGYIVCTVIRPIKKNEQLFISSITWDKLGSDTIRRAVLKSRYINCTCERCKLNSFRSNHQMKSDADYLFIQQQFKLQNFDSYDRKQIDSMKQRCFDFLQKYGRMNWCTEMGHMIEVLSFLSSE